MLQARALLRHWRPTSVLYAQTRHASERAKTLATLEDKRKAAQLGGGQKRIDKQHQTV